MISSKIVNIIVLPRAARVCGSKGSEAGRLLFLDEGVKAIGWCGDGENKSGMGILPYDFGQIKQRFVVDVRKACHVSQFFSSDALTTNDRRRVMSS